MAPAIVLENAGASYRDGPVFAGLNLTVNPGERVAIMGRSGAGKSTLLNLIYSQFANRVALIPQASALVLNLSVFHNVFMGRLDRHTTLYNLRALIWPPKQEVRAVGEVLHPLRLTEKIFAKTGELSGGQQQRTSVARALYNGRPIIVGDEPVSALDRVQAGEVLELLSQRHETAIYALHDIRLALAHTGRIVLLERGKIVLDEPSSNLDLDRLLPYFESEMR